MNLLNTSINRINTSIQNLNIKKLNRRQVETEDFNITGQYNFLTKPLGIDEGSSQLNLSNKNLRNFGSTWYKKNGPQTQLSRKWSYVDNRGKCQAACLENGPIYISNDFGNNWLAYYFIDNWCCINISEDGEVIAASTKEGLLYISTDSMATFTIEANIPLYEQSQTQLETDFSCLSLSDDGNYLIFGGTITYLSVIQGCSLYVSDNVKNSRSFSEYGPMSIVSIDQDDTYFYLGYYGTSGVIARYLKSNLTTIKEITPPVIEGVVYSWIDVSVDDNVVVLIGQNLVALSLNQGETYIYRALFDCYKCQVSQNKISIFTKTGCYSLLVTDQTSGAELEFVYDNHFQYSINLDENGFLDETLATYYIPSYYNQYRTVVQTNGLIYLSYDSGNSYSNAVSIYDNSQYQTENNFRGSFSSGTGNIVWNNDIYYFSDGIYYFSTSLDKKFRVNYSYSYSNGYQLLCCNSYVLFSNNYGKNWSIIKNDGNIYNFAMISDNGEILISEGTNLWKSTLNNPELWTLYKTFDENIVKFTALQNFSKIYVLTRAGGSWTIYYGVNFTSSLSNGIEITDIQVTSTNFYYSFSNNLIQTALNDLTTSSTLTLIEILPGADPIYNIKSFYIYETEGLETFINTYTNDNTVFFYSSGDFPANFSDLSVSELNSDPISIQGPCYSFYQRTRISFFNESGKLYSSDNYGQTFSINNYINQFEVEQYNPKLACSSSGKKLISLSENRNLLISQDDGNTWLFPSLFLNNNRSIAYFKDCAISSTGRYMLACSYKDSDSDSFLLLSKNSGRTFSCLNVPDDKYYTSCCISGDGMIIGVLDTTGILYYSEDRGQNFIEITLSQNDTIYRQMVISTDGKIIYVISKAKNLYKIEDKTVTTYNFAEFPYAIATNADGKFVTVCCLLNENYYNGYNSQIKKSSLKVYTSEDYGTEFEEALYLESVKYSKYPYSVGMSANGQYQLITTFGGIYYSDDYGNFFKPGENNNPLLSGFIASVCVNSQGTVNKVMDTCSNIYENLSLEDNSLAILRSPDITDGVYYIDGRYDVYYFVNNCNVFLPKITYPRRISICYKTTVNVVAYTGDNIEGSQNILTSEIIYPLILCSDGKNTWINENFTSSS